MTEARFLSKVEKTSTCWLFNGTNNGKSGYKVFWYEGQNRPAHRIAYLLWKGPIPSGEVVRHMCFNPACVNPDHLLTGTQKENIEDSVAAGRHQHGGSHWHATPLSTEILDYVRVSDKSTRELAEELGISQTTICKIINGTHWQLTS